MTKLLTATVEIVDHFGIEEGHPFGTHGGDVLQFAWNNREIGHALGMGDGVIVHQRPVVVRNAHVVDVADVECRQHILEGHERGLRLIADILPVDGNMLLSVGSLVCVPETESMSGFVCDHVALNTPC